MRDGYPDLNDYDIVGFATYACGVKVAQYVFDYMTGLEAVQDKLAFVFTTYGKDITTLLNTNICYDKSMRNFRYARHS